MALSYRRILWQSAVVAHLLLNAGCDAKLSPAPKGGDGELRVLIPFEPSSLDPNSLQDEAALLIAPNLFNKLVTFDTDFQLLPDLAESWTVAEGGRRYTFALRRDVRWHDGRAFTSKDVRGTFRRLAAHPSLAEEAVRRIDRIETPDDHTVVIRLAEPWAPFLPTIAWDGAYILPDSPEGSLPAREPGSEKPVGTGPFQLQEWVRRERITLRANLHYFRPGPYLDRVTYRFVPSSDDPSKSAELLLSGQADYIAVRPAPEVALRLSRDPRLKVRTSPSGARYLCAFNLRRRPLRDLRVRQAINAAIDRHRLVDRALQGFGAPALGFYTPVLGWAYNPRAHVPPFDCEHAEALLDSAGFPRGSRGTRLALELLLPVFPPFPELARELEEQLGEIGIEIHPVRLSLPDWYRRTVRDRDFDLSLVAGTHGPDPENLNFRFGSRSPNQFLGYASAELDAALADGARTVDLPGRARAYFRAQEILARDLPIAPLAEGVHIAVFRPGLRGLPPIEARGLVSSHDYSLVRLKGGGS